MAKGRYKRSSGIEELSKMPWWVSVVLAVLTFISLKVVLPLVEMQNPLGKVIQAFMSNFAWLIVILSLLSG